MAITINGSANTVAGLAAGGLPDNTVDGGNLAMGSDAAGDVLYYNGTDYIRLAKGTDGQVLTLASGVPTWADSAGYDNTPAFSAYLSSDQTGISHDTETAVFFNAEQFDTDSAFNTANGTFTVPSGKGGKYQLNTQVSVDDINQGAYLTIGLYINGSLQSNRARSYDWSPDSDKIITCSMNNVISLSAGDTVNIYALHSGTGTQSSENHANWFSMFRLAGV